MKRMQSVNSKFLRIGLISLAFLFLGSYDLWAEYPDKPITMIVPFAPGGTVDICLRPLAAAAKEILGQPIVLDYHAGGSGSVGLAVLMNKKADGYSLGVTTQSPLVGQHLTKVPYDLLKDFTPIMQYSDASLGIVVLGTSPWKTFKEFLDTAKTNPKKIRYSSAGPGTTSSLVMVALAKQYQIEWTHIPFKGASEALGALLGSHVEAYSSTMAFKSHIKTGRLRLLAALGEKRIRDFPDVPTLTELGVPIVASNFNAIIAPKGVSPEILEKIHQTFKKAMEDPAFIKAANSVDQVITYRSPQETAKYFLEQNEEIKELLKYQKQITQ